MTLSGGRKVTILPDKVVKNTHTGRQAETELDIKDNYNPKKKTVTVSITIQTYYKVGVKPSGKQSYGRGRTRSGQRER